MVQLKKLLWLSGIPASYTRRLQAQLECAGIPIEYIFFQDTEKNSSQRLYETGELSTNARIYSKENEKECRLLVKKYSEQKECGILFCGIYPFMLLKLFLKYRNAPCAKLYWSDTNIAEFKFPSVLKYLRYHFMLKHCDILLTMGSQNTLFYRLMLGPVLKNSKTILEFPCPYNKETYRFPERKVKQEEEPVEFLYLGRLEPEKNPMPCLDACKLLLQLKFTKFHMTFAGGGSLEALLKKTIEEQQLERYVTVTGAVKSTDTPEIYRSADVFILSSKRDAWGLVVNEALTAGLPVILPVWAGAAADLVIDGFNGIKLFDIKPETIMEAMKRFIEDKEMLNALSKHASTTMEYSNKNDLTGIETFRKIFNCSQERLSPQIKN